MPERAKAVIIAGLREQENEVELVRSYGYKAILFSPRISMEEALALDVPVEIDLNNEERVLAKARRLAERFDIRGVFTLNEYRVPLAAKIAEALGIGHGISQAAASNCRNKKRTRQLLAEHQVPSARFATVRSAEEGRAALATIPPPVVVKPSNDSGSSLVVRCDTPDEVARAIAAIQQHGRNLVGQDIDPDILLEEFLDGPEYSVEAYTAGGQTTVLAITAKRLTPPPLAVEVGHMVPAILEDADEDAIQRLVAAALAALGVDNAVTHTEVRLTAGGPRIVEVNARTGGDKIPLLVRAITGYDLREIALRLALGEPVDESIRQPVAALSAAVRYLVADRDGTAVVADPEELADLTGVQTVDLDVQSGDSVRRATSNDGRLGYVLVYGSVRQHADRVADAALERLAFKVRSNVLWLG